MNTPDASTELAAHLFGRLQADYAETWQSLLEIQAKFQSHGHQIFLVGGAVRNLVLGVPLKDFDLATDALPDHILKMFRTVIPTGIQHGTVTLVYRKQHFEITTFRLDGAYTDARRPDSVSFTASLEEDLKRRDFTINAMALDLGGRCLIDPHQGCQDLVRRLIRTVGLASDRFNEDGLRIMRGLRFAAQLDFPLETATWDAMGLRLERLAQVSIERFRDEILKTLESPVPSRGLYLMREIGALGMFLPELGDMAATDFAMGCLMIDLVPAHSHELRLAALVSQVSVETARAMLTRLRLSTNETKQACHFNTLLAHEYAATWNDRELRLFASRAGKANLRQGALFLNCRAVARDWLAYNPVDAVMLVPVPVAKPDGSDSLDRALDYRPAWSSVIGELRRMEDAACQSFTLRVDGLLRDNPPLAIGELAINGGQMQAAGIAAGPLMGRILANLLEWVIDDPTRNQAATLTDRAKTLYGDPNKLS